VAEDQVGAAGRRVAELGGLDVDVRPADSRLQDADERLALVARRLGDVVANGQAVGAAGKTVTARIGEPISSQKPAGEWRRRERRGWAGPKARPERASARPCRSRPAWRARRDPTRLARRCAPCPIRAWWSSCPSPSRGEARARRRRTCGPGCGCTIPSRTGTRAGTRRRAGARVRTRRVVRAPVLGLDVGFTARPRPSGQATGNGTHGGADDRTNGPPTRHRRPAPGRSGAAAPVRRRRDARPARRTRDHDSRRPGFLGSAMGTSWGGVRNDDINE
jgi:hypothetical protein